MSGSLWVVYQSVCAQFCRNNQLQFASVKHVRDAAGVLFLYLFVTNLSCYQSLNCTVFQMESLDLDASGKSELTVSRSSSLIANLSGNDEEDTDTRDLFIVVDDPEKHSGTMDSYVTFRVTVKVRVISL